MKMWLTACCVISMIRGYSTFTVLIIWQCFAENALKKTILMKDALLLIFMKSKKWERCIGWISKWIRSNLRREKIMPTIAVSLKKLLLIRLLEIQSGFSREERKCFKSKKSNKPKCLRCRKNRKNFWHRLMPIYLICLQIQTLY